MTPPRVPFIQSRYLGRTIFLNELADLTDSDLALLDTETHSLHETTSRSLQSDDIRQEDWGTVEKLMRASGSFLYAIEQEKTQRHRSVSILGLLRQLDEVRAECELLKARLREVCA